MRHHFNLKKMDKGWKKHYIHTYTLIRANTNVGTLLHHIDRGAVDPKNADHQILCLYYESLIAPRLKGIVSNICFSNQQMSINQG